MCALCSNRVNWVTFQTASQMQEWKTRDGEEEAVGSSCGWRSSDSVALHIIKFLRSVLWGTSASRVATMEDSQRLGWTRLQVSPCHHLCRYLDMLPHVLLQLCTSAPPPAVLQISSPPLSRRCTPPQPLINYSPPSPCYRPAVNLHHEDKPRCDGPQQHFRIRNAQHCNLGRLTILQQVLVTVSVLFEQKNTYYL